MKKSLPLVGLALLTAALTGCAALSPDGSRVAFLWPFDADDRSLAIIKTDGTGFRYVPGSAGAVMAVWSPDGRTILFAVDKGDPLTYDLHAYDVASGRTRRLTGGIVPPVAWRWDGQAFLAVAVRGPADLEAVWFKRSGEVTARVELPFKEPWPMFPPIWLSRSESVALVGGQLGFLESTEADVYIVAPTGVHRVTDRGNVIGLGLSSDRTSLLWVEQGVGPQDSFLSLNAYHLRSGARVRLPFALKGDDLADPGFAVDNVPLNVFVFFSPDGRRLALVAGFTSQGTDGGTTQVYQAVYVVQVDGSEPRLLHRTPPYPADAAGQPWFLWPSWFPDGKRVIVTRGTPAHEELAIHSADGTKARLLVRAPRWDL